jgi:prepilin-type N-terminal cleavage/methylation domain-containing protein
MRLTSRSRSRAGFSLIELIVVIAVIAAIAAIVIPSIGSLTSAATDSSADRNLQLAKSTYANYVAAGGTDNATTAATAMLAGTGWSGTATVAGKTITFKVPQITGLNGANGKTGTTATTAAQLATLITP